MAGIPSAEGVRRERREVRRVLTRVAAVAGMVTLGWLLGAATALAEDGAAPPAAPSGVLAPGLPPLVEAAAEALPVAETQLSATLPLPPTGPAELPRTIAPVLEPVLSPVQPLPTGLDEYPPTRIAEALTPAEPAEPVLPAEQATGSRPAAPAMPAPALPSGAFVGPAPPVTPQSAGTEPPVERSAGPSVAAGDAALPHPAHSPETGAITCPVGSATTNTTAKGPHTVTLTEGFARAPLALVRHQQYPPENSPPGSPHQQPSTSPD